MHTCHFLAGIVKNKSNLANNIDLYHSIQPFLS